MKYSMHRLKKIIDHHKQNVLETFIVIVAGLIYSIAFKYFVFPSRVILTGTEGIAASLSYYFDRQWVFYLCYAIFQTILITMAFLRIGRRFAMRTSIVVACVLFIMPLLPNYEFANPEPQNERILLVIFGGILAGLAKAIALRLGGSTGDEDIPSAYYAMKYLKPVGFIAIIAASISTTFGMTLELLSTGLIEPAINTLMYTSIYIFVAAETLNNFYRKFKLSLVTVVTRKAEEIGGAIKSISPHRTATVQTGHGLYSKSEFQVLKTVITHEELRDVIRAIEKADPECFLFHHDLEGISGRYYISPIGKT